MRHGATRGPWSSGRHNQQTLGCRWGSPRTRRRDLAFWRGICTRTGRSSPIAHGSRIDGPIQARRDPAEFGKSRLYEREEKTKSRKKKSGQPQLPVNALTEFACCCKGIRQTVPLVPCLLGGCCASRARTSAGRRQWGRAIQTWTSGLPFSTRAGKLLLAQSGIGSHELLSVPTSVVLGEQNGLLAQFSNSSTLIQRHYLPYISAPFYTDYAHEFIPKPKWRLPTFWIHWGMGNSTLRDLSDRSFPRSRAAVFHLLQTLLEFLAFTIVTPTMPLPRQFDFEYRLAPEDRKLLANRQRLAMRPFACQCRLAVGSG